MCSSNILFHHMPSSFFSLLTDAVFHFSFCLAPFFSQLQPVLIYSELQFGLDICSMCELAQPIFNQNIYYFDYCSLSMATFVTNLKHSKV